MPQAGFSTIPFSSLLQRVCNESRRKTDTKGLQKVSPRHQCQELNCVFSLVPNDHTRVLLKTTAHYLRHDSRIIGMFTVLPFFAFCLKLVILRTYHLEDFVLITALNGFFFQKLFGLQLQSLIGDYQTICRLHVHLNSHLQAREIEQVSICSQLCQ